MTPLSLVRSKTCLRNAAISLCISTLLAILEATSTLGRFFSLMYTIFFKICSSKESASWSWSVASTLSIKSSRSLSEEAFFFESAALESFADKDAIFGKIFKAFI